MHPLRDYPRTMTYLLIITTLNLLLNLGQEIFK